MREINTYIKFQNLLFELVDEAKIDVYKIEQFNNSLATAQGTQLIQTRIQLSNLLKNYRNALVVDKEDDYEQKQIAFGGLADIFQEFRINLCAALKIPYNKLFGESATGLGNGEDSMENYNSMLDSDVRDHVRPLVRESLSLRMRAVFGYLPEFTFKFQPLRVLKETDQAEVDAKKQARALELYDRDLLSGKEVMESLHKDKLLNVDSEVLQGKREPISPLEMEQDAQDTAAKDAAKPDKKANALERLRTMLSTERSLKRSA
jgi:phage-related protein (TIGR01555 family)